MVYARAWTKVAGKERVYVTEYRRGCKKAELVFDLNKKAWIAINGYPCRAIKNVAESLVSKMIDAPVQRI
jgi:hypothetical protein